MEQQFIISQKLMMNIKAFNRLNNMLSINQNEYSTKMNNYTNCLSRKANNLDYLRRKVEKDL